MLLIMERGVQKHDCRKVGLTSCFELAEGLCIIQSLFLRTSLFSPLLVSFKLLYGFPSTFLI